MVNRNSLLAARKEKSFRFSMLDARKRRKTKDERQRMRAKPKRVSSTKHRELPEVLLEASLHFAEGHFLKEPYRSYLNEALS